MLKNVWYQLHYFIQYCMAMQNILYIVDNMFFQGGTPLFRVELIQSVTDALYFL
jgi:hypothetical protein